MQQSGEYRIEAPAPEVWAALNDPERLAACISGCQAMEKLSATEFHAKVKAKVGPVSAVFDADITLSEVEPPHAYTLSGQVKGGAAGFGRGGAKVRLEADGTATLLRYEIRASVGGKLAQIGSRLIDGTSRKMAEDFFSCFAQSFAPPAEEENPA